MQTEFILYSGLNTIGGVNASVTYGKHRVVFEMGAPYEPGVNPYDGIVQRRKKAWVRDALRLGSLPRIDGIFRKADLAGVEGIISAEDSPFETVVFITHLHLDHMANMGMVAPQIPVYLTRNAQIIERALEATGEGVPTLDRQYTHFEPNVPIQFGEIEVLPILNQIASYGHYSLLITTPDGTIHWSGDLSLHGHETENRFKEIEMLKKRGVDVMLCECTRFSDEQLLAEYTAADGSIKATLALPEGLTDEAGLEEELYAILSGTSGLIVFNYYQREMQDVGRLLAWAEKLGRECVFEPDAAYIIHRFFGIQPNVFVPDSPRYPEDPAQWPHWYAELRAAARVVEHSQIVNEPHLFMLQNSYRHLMELLDLPAEGGAYLHAEGMPLDSRDSAYHNMTNIVALAGFPFIEFDLNKRFGHGFPGAIKYFVDQIDPKVLIPCHSYHPEKLLPLNGRQLLPKLNQKYVLKNGDLIEA